MPTSFLSTQGIKASSSDDAFLFAGKQGRGSRKAAPFALFTLKSAPDTAARSVYAVLRRAEGYPH